MPRNFSKKKVNKLESEERLRSIERHRYQMEKQQMQQANPGNMNRLWITSTRRQLYQQRN